MYIKLWWDKFIKVHKAINWTQRLWYNFRWQLSTPTLAIFSSLTVAFLTHNQLRWPSGPEWWGAVVANFIGANIFIYIDKLIFKTNS